LSDQGEAFSRCSASAPYQGVWGCKYLFIAPGDGESQPTVVRPGTRPIHDRDRQQRQAGRVLPPRRYDTLPLSRRPSGGTGRIASLEGRTLTTLITFFNSAPSGWKRPVEISANADVHRRQGPPNRNLLPEGTPLSYLDAPLTPALEQCRDGPPAAGPDWRPPTFCATKPSPRASALRFCSPAFLKEFRRCDASRSCFRLDSSPISVARYGSDACARSVARHGLVPPLRGLFGRGGRRIPSILAVNTRGLRACAREGCSLAATQTVASRDAGCGRQLFRQETGGTPVGDLLFQPAPQGAGGAPHLPTPSGLGSPAIRACSCRPTLALAAEKPNASL